MCFKEGKNRANQPKPALGGATSVAWNSCSGRESDLRPRPEYPLQPARSADRVGRNHVHAPGVLGLLFHSGIQPANPMGSGSNRSSPQPRGVHRHVEGKKDD